MGERSATSPGLPSAGRSRKREDAEAAAACGEAAGSGVEGGGLVGAREMPWLTHTTHLVGDRQVFLDGDGDGDAHRWARGRGASWTWCM